MSKPAHAPVPVFKLYGETTAWPTPDLIHWESIESRSRLHEWEIKPHQHGDLVQLLYVRSGRAELEVEGLVNRVERASLQVVPALCVHGFRFSDDVDGHVLTLALPLVEQVTGLLDSQALLAPACFAAGDSQPYLDTLFEAISREYARQEPGRELMLQSLISVLLVWIGRRALERTRSDTQQQDRGRLHLQEFTRLLEQHFREHLPIEHYAQRLGISAAHLNALCRRLAGQSALQMINQRLLLEAKRCLVYTAMTINQVSDSLGFSEPAYFSRFFKRGTGQSPKAFRIAR
ncbi:helix-turn-helix domain-containing protein [Metapseudomonas resinovorans]|uniref:AraC family transcriptional regulator PobR n=1 Tax=Metapseudomonas resinovorans NBRC 106553 TaxID=1245471 RepID=S6AJX4_METRE|nr:helix-turn-helix domain-containing protein [Pseudomonas resinovorans]BAN48850.1 AraC family transcriptional regulator PobR [Pseudomonas resinovorans NBRC 106553]